MNTKQFITLTLSLVMSMSMFAQKDELKAASKAIKKKDFPAAVSALSQAEGLIENADGKTKAKYYYLRGVAAYADGEATSIDDLELIVKSFKEVIKIERESGSLKYTPEAVLIIGTAADMVKAHLMGLYSEGIKEKDNSKLSEAAAGVYKVYLQKPQDTSYLYFAAKVNSMAGNYEESNAQFLKLLGLGYTGGGAQYSATSTVNGEKIVYETKKGMEAQIKLELAKDPVTKVLASKENEIFKDVLRNYESLKQNDEALEFLKMARKTYPEDFDLIISEANAYYKKGDKVKFKETLEEAIRLNPTDTQLYYNVGVMNTELGYTEAAKKSFEKCIELDPEYTDAYNAIGNLILKDVAAVQEEMNANGGNFKKYDDLKENKLYPILNNALPYLEKAYSFENDEVIRKQINNIYENLGMEKRID